MLMSDLYLDCSQSHSVSRYALPFEVAALPAYGRHSPPAVAVVQVHSLLKMSAVSCFAASSQQRGRSLCLLVINLVHQNLSRLLLVSSGHYARLCLHAEHTLTRG